MALNPDQIENTQFSSSLRGYDKQEVKAYLARVARSMRQAEAEQAAQAPVVTAPLPRPALSEQSDEDRFGALGERIAALLRNAHDSAAQIKATAEAEVAEVRVQAEADLADAQAEAELARAEAEEVRAAAHADAEEIRSAAEANGLARLEERQVEIESAEISIQQDQETAMLELSDAREQVTVLLEQARSQSEFIRLEADDIIREKIRTNLDAAEDRLNVLRNTEEVSRERIRLAQDELESALGRLESQPAPALPHGAEHLIIDEAEGRALEAGYVVGESVPVDQSELDEADDLGAADSIVEAGGIDSDDADGYGADSPTFDADVADSDADTMVEADLADADSEHLDSHDPEAGSHDAADADDAEVVPEDDTEEPSFGSVAVVEDEDALTKLVREAMQTAVETAQTGD